MQMKSRAIRNNGIYHRAKLTTAKKANFSKQRHRLAWGGQHLFSPASLLLQSPPFPSPGAMRTYPALPTPSSVPLSGGIKLLSHLRPLITDNYHWSSAPPSPPKLSFERSMGGELAGDSTTPGNLVCQKWKGMDLEIFSFVFSFLPFIAYIFCFVSTTYKREEKGFSFKKKKIKRIKKGMERDPVKQED